MKKLDNKGMTLAEVMVGIAMIAIAASILVSIVLSAARMRKATVDVIRDNDDTFTQMERTLAYGGVIPGEDNGAADITLNELSFEIVKGESADGEEQTVEYKGYIVDGSQVKYQSIEPRFTVIK